MIDLRLFLIKKDDIRRVWSNCSVILEKAIKYADGKYKIEDIYSSVSHGTMQLWVAYSKPDIKAVAVTEICNYPSKKVMIIMFAAGQDFEQWKHFNERMKEFAKQNDCESIDVYGRPGFLKKLAKAGYRHTHNVYSLEL